WAQSHGPSGSRFTRAGTNSHSSAFGQLLPRVCTNARAATVRAAHRAMSTRRMRLVAGRGAEYSGLFETLDNITEQYMSVERQIELKRRYHRKAKMRKLKAKLETATGADREKVLYKIKRLSPFWTEPAKA